MPSFLPKGLKQQITEKYYELMKDYMNTQLFTELLYVKNHFYLGFHCIHRIFEYILFKTKNIDKAFYSAQQGSYYYLEYLQQIYTNNLHDTMKSKDIVMFVLKKTVGEAYDSMNSENPTSEFSSSICNIMTLDGEMVSINYNEWIGFFPKLEVLNKVLLYWDQTDWTWKQRLQLFETHYSKFLDCIEKSDLAFMFLESLQEAHNFSFENYTELVSAFLYFTEKMRRNRSGSITEDEKQEWFVLKLHVHKEEIQKKISEGRMKELVRWLFSDV